VGNRKHATNSFEIVENSKRVDKMGNIGNINSGKEESKQDNKRREQETS